jgi:phenylacetate-CoA ligase
VSSAYTATCSRLLFPLHERLKGHRSVAWRRQLERSQWLGADALEHARVERLRGFLTDIGQHVPYYRDLFRGAGFDPRALRSVDALVQLPTLGKAEIRAHTERLKADDHGPLKRYNTGGSSGEPLVFYIGRDRVSHDVAAKWRATRWWGVDIGDPEVVVWGSPVELGAQDRVRRWRDRLLRTQLLPAFEMSDSRLDDFVAEIRRIRPRMLFGYPSALSHIARHARKRGVALDDLGVRVAFVTSERLYDEQRAIISEGFGCPVANGYGGRDAGFIAHECPEGGMHLTAEDIVVELLDANGHPVADDMPGEITVTHMATRDFPFVRYRTGDVAVRGTAPCRCGRGLPLLQEIRGRTTDFVVAADGTVMHGLALIYILRDLRGIEAFKITQESLQRTVVQLVAGPEFDRGSVGAVTAAFRRRLGESVEVPVEFVDRIPAEKSGKFRYVVSRVAGSEAVVA